MTQTSRQSRCIRHLSIRIIVIFVLLSLALTFVTLRYAADPQTNSGQHLLAAQQKLRFSGIVNMLQDQKKDVPKKTIDFGCKPQVQDTRPLLSVPRIAKYCNIPNSESAGEEGLVPPGYKLLSAHVVIRHGDRSPLINLPNEDPSKLSCLTDVDQFNHVPKLQNFVQVMEQASHAESENSPFSRWARYPSRAECGQGQLTGQGAIQHVLNGLHLHQRYVQPPHNLPLDVTNVAAYSTIVSRTFQSAMAFFYGLLPSFEPSKIKLNSSQSIMFCDSTAVPGSVCSCPGIEAMRTKAITTCKGDPHLVESMEMFKSSAAVTVSKVLGADIARLPSPEGVMDALSRYTCHSIPPPCVQRPSENGGNTNDTINKKDCPTTWCVTAATLEGVWAPVDAHSKCIHNDKEYKKYATATTQGLLLRIAQAFEKHIHASNSSQSSSGKDNPLFVLYSGHDNTLTPLIAALGLDDTNWPGYASRIVFELYQRRALVGDGGSETRMQYFIRILFNGKAVTSQALFCREQSAIAGVKDVCEFQRFHGHVTQLRVQGLCAGVRQKVVSRTIMPVSG